MNDRLFSVRFKLSTGNVSITAYDHGDPVGPYGHHTIHCKLSVNGRELFQPEGFYVGIPAGKCIDTDYAQETAVALFCLKPGDTDSDFFKYYTPAQLEWVTANGEELNMLKCERFGGDP